jgi:hypothetical protein
MLFPDLAPATLQQSCQTSETSLVSALELELALKVWHCACRSLARPAVACC